MAYEVQFDEFNLETYGTIALLEAGDKDFTDMGLPESLDEVVPEFISRLAIEGEVYYIVYIMFDNDDIDQIYIPESSMSDEIRQGVLDQPIEEEEEANTN